MTRMTIPTRRTVGITAMLWSVGILLASTLSSQVDREMSGVVTFDGEPVPDVPVELHRVTRAGGGPIGSTTTAPDGTFGIPYDASVDPGDFVVHFATTTFRGVRYFGPVVHLDEAAEDVRIEVFDTISVGSADPVGVARRDVVIVPHPSDGWEINELIRIRNEGGRTIVSSGAAPIWEQRLPEGAREVQISDGEVSEGVRLMDGRVLLTDPVLPGDREVFIRYRLGSRAAPAAFPIDHPTSVLSMLVRQPSPNFEISGLGDPTEINVEGETFVRFATADLEPGDRPAFAWRVQRGGSPVSPVVAAGLVVGLILLSTGIVAVRRRSA